MGNIFKIITILGGLFMLDNPQKIKNVKREIARYDSLAFYYKATPEELKSMQEDREFEGKKTKTKKHE